VSTVAGTRRRNAPGLSRYFDALLAGDVPPRELEPLDEATRARERLLLGLRLDEPLAVADVAGALDREAAARLAERGLVTFCAADDPSALRLTRRGRFLGGGVTAELLAL
jgi:coproporphyrinogen III oxidase-like Fe-S oxidoreductase